MKKKWLLFLFLSLSLAGLGILSFFVPREDIYAYWLLMAFCFLAYGGQMILVSEFEQKASFYLLSGTLLRLLPLFALPMLSDDYFRFIWDGRLLAHGENPFMLTPREYMESPELAAQLGLTPELFEGMNSPDFFTIYPPVLQGIFFLASVIFPNSIAGSVFVMKLFLFLGEIGSMYLLGKLLEKANLPIRYMGWYAWNPLVIIELVGNVHFEGLMIFFLLWMIYLLQHEKNWASVIPFVLAICTKLLPLMLAPLLIRRLGWGKSVLYGVLTAILTFLLFLTIFDQETFTHLMASVDLYFANFEFNASVWYVIREGFGHLSQVNLLTLVGKFLGLATLVSILVFAFTEKNPSHKNLSQAMMWAFCLYFLFASIVHPWYITTLVALASLGRFRFPAVWTVLLPLTYFTYRSLPYDENLWLVLVEYVGVMAFLIWEGVFRRKKA